MGHNSIFFPVCIVQIMEYCLEIGRPNLSVPRQTKPSTPSYATVFVPYIVRMTMILAQVH